MGGEGGVSEHHYLVDGVNGKDLSSADAPHNTPQELDLRLGLCIRLGLEIAVGPARVRAPQGVNIKHALTSIRATPVSPFTLRPKCPKNLSLFAHSGQSVTYSIAPQCFTVHSRN